jgi:AcrR family transcriptional regulator
MKTDVQVDDSVVQVDGRVLRGQRTGARIERACRDLIEESGRAPTMLEVSRRASVALRSIYHHYRDAETCISRALALEPRRNLVITIEPADAS